MNMNQSELDHVERTLGDAVICQRCGATLATYAEICSADLDDPCPGFLAIERARLPEGSGH